MALVRKETLYEILGVKRTSTVSQIHSQFGELKMFWESLSKHAPREAELKLIELRNAFAILSDLELRKKYDETLDFEFVLLDGKPKDEDIEQAYEVYRHNHQKTYQEIYSEFQFFKEDLGSTLWMLKTTTLYLIFSLFLYSGIILLLTLLSGHLHQKILYFLKMKNILVPAYVIFACIGYIFFRNLVQIPALKLRKKKLENL